MSSEGVCCSERAPLPSPKDLVNIEMFLTAKEVEESLERRETATCLAWCHDNKSRLRKMKVRLRRGGAWAPGLGGAGLWIRCGRGLQGTAQALPLALEPAGSRFFGPGPRPGCLCLAWVWLCSMVTPSALGCGPVL